ncbi:putative RNA-dependent RNA polymerase [Rhizoctonia solani mitovirus 31]|uniref:RNA-dependent RNA polymerase n=1 Tax=Rhizoctonia solani mitovirus 31 TaxID=2599422 RepID=A0ABX5Y3T8_9VIRU|nr:putative RNA-dependent RNA polymerase [Rhizoctonia solani mitovirus 31]QDW65421.1 putative RNA-dependent RNA polymerase [Rhizoctonia solani mitovirus 31]
MKTQFIKQISAFKVHLKSINAMASVKGGWSLVRIVVLLLPTIGLRSTRAKVKSIVVFLRHTYRLFKYNGAKGACLMLKVYSVTLQQSIGGHVVKDLTELKFRISRTNRGLPRVIPLVMRKAIREGDPHVIRFWLSLFNLYRMIEFKGDMRLASLSKTIISPAKIVESKFQTLKYELLMFVPIFYKLLVSQTGISARSLRRELMQNHGEAVAFPLLKSSPFTKGTQDFEDLTKAQREEAMVINPVVSTHPLAIHEAANALENSPELYDSVHYFLGLLPDGSRIREAFRLCVRLPAKQGVQSATKPFLGKLSLKEEAAGKVRVFAMVDPWTQWLLKPLHDMIFDHILAGIPQDGTRDQLSPVKSLIVRKPKSLFSLDLSAATDRLPLWLQIAILAGISGEEYAQNWAHLLVKRDYVLSLKDKNNDRMVRYPLRYAVGQPMGALSSWAMLALTHHFIVQFAAYRVGYRAWFSEYGVLGDDIVLGRADVAKEYLTIMQVLGVGIGLHKSLISLSGTALEFAKKTFFKGVDVSPITLTELQASFNSPASAVTFIKKYNLTLASFIKAAGFGYRVLGGLHKPIGKLNSKVRLMILAMNIPTSIEEVTAFFEIGKPRSGRSQLDTQAVLNVLVDNELPRIKRALNKIRSSAHQLEGHELHARDIANELLGRVSPIIVLNADDKALFLDAAAEAKAILKQPKEEILFEGTDRQKSVLTSSWALEAVINNPYGSVISRQTRNGKVLGLLEAMDNVIEDLSVCESDVHVDGEFMGYNYSTTHAQYMKTLRRIAHAQFSKPCLECVKTLQYLVQGQAHHRILVAAQAISDSLVKLQLGKWDIPFPEMFMGLISISRDIGSLPISSVGYTRIIDAERNRFTDGTLIRLWKALAGVAQGTKREKLSQSVETEFKGWW